MRAPPRTRDLQPSRAGARRNVPALRAGPPDQHRIMDPLCDVDPFRRTPAWPPGRKVRLRLSPHFSAFQPPFGLGQKIFCPLGSRPRVRGSWVKPTPWVMQTPLRPCPGSKAAPMRNGLRAESGQDLQVFGPVRTPPFSRTRLVAGEPPDPVPLGRELQASGGRAAATRRPGRPQLQARGQPFPHS